MNNINVLQRGFSGCGPACLASVAAYYGLFISVIEIQKYTVINRNGTTINELISSAEKLGFVANGAKGDIQSIKLIPKPFIAHLKLSNSTYHFVSIYDTNDAGILIMDPAIGKTQTIPFNKFLHEWTGSVVLLEPGNCFKPGNYKSATKNKSSALVLLAYIALFIYSIWFMFIK